MYKYTGDDNSTLSINKNDYVYYLNDKWNVLDEDTAKKKGYGVPIYLWQKTTIS